MLVKLNQSMVGNTLTTDGRFAGHFAYSKGDEVDFPKEEAERLIARGAAQPSSGKSRS